MNITTDQTLQVRRRPLIKGARRVSRDNAVAVAAWCGGTPLADGVRVPIVVGQVEFSIHAKPGMWVVLGVDDCAEVFTDLEFSRNFDVMSRP